MDIGLLNFGFVSAIIAIIFGIIILVKPQGTCLSDWHLPDNYRNILFCRLLKR